MNVNILSIVLLMLIINPFLLAQRVDSLEIPNLEVYKAYVKQMELTYMHRIKGKEVDTLEVAPYLKTIRYYHKNGNLREETSYYKNFMHDKYLEFDNNGKLQELIYFDRGFQLLRIKLDPAGNITRLEIGDITPNSKVEEKLTRISYFYLEDVTEVHIYKYINTSSIAYSFDAEGNLERIAPRKNSWPHGDWIEFDNRGAMKSKYTFQEGELLDFKYY